MITLDTKTIVTTLDTHKECVANGDMDPSVVIDDHIHEIKRMLDKIEMMNNHKGSAAAELILECVEDVYDYVRER